MAEVMFETDNNGEFRWSFPEQGEDVVFVEGRNVDTQEWTLAAEISLSDASLTRVMYAWLNNTRLFDVVESICAECAKLRLAA